MLTTRPALPPTVIAVSLKLYLDHDETVAWMTAVAELMRRRQGAAFDDVGLVVLPGTASLSAVVGLAGEGIAVGAQDVSWADRGAYTGEVSARQLRQIGCRYVEVGHAERRRLFQEDEGIVARKLAAATREGLIPILCIGEPERGDPRTAAEQVTGQLRSALSGIGGTAALVVAYEPIWAIGQDEPASPEHIATVCDGIREAIVADRRVSDARLLYGGSAGPGLLTTLGPAVDGLFLGRFAHDVGALGRVLDEAAGHAIAIAARGDREGD